MGMVDAAFQKGPGMSETTRAESIQRFSRHCGWVVAGRFDGNGFAAGRKGNDVTSVIRARDFFSSLMWIAAVTLLGLGWRVAACEETADLTDLSNVKVVDGDGKPLPIPAPPEELAKLIKAGNVSFEFYDPKIVTRSFAGETKFEFRYAYRSRSNWKQIRSEGKPAIEVLIDYQEITLNRQHRILLPQEMMADDIFSRRLTLHEFDHVRISCDPRLPDLLKAMLMERNSRIVQVLDETEHEFEGKPSAQDLARIGKEIVKLESDKVFNDFVSIVSIRYQELDRVSNYGLKALPAEERFRIIESPPQPPQVESDAPNVANPELPPTEPLN